MAGAVILRKAPPMNVSHSADDEPTEFITLPLRQDELLSDRHFEVWNFHVSTCRLLLRSVPTVRHATRIDVCFAGVSALALQPSYDGLHVRKADAAGTSTRRSST